MSTATKTAALRLTTAALAGAVTADVDRHVAAQDWPRIASADPEDQWRAMQAMLGA